MPTANKIDAVIDPVQSRSSPAKKISTGMPPKYHKK